ncbi:curlin repeat-containing protein [Halomonas sp. 3A7M]|uniref:curlin repeat-containing protein n=1 Tax=Halomonas sp. 3A7M TaxID=2742616 RepID=UPI00299F8DCF|nr:curlin repeat-containing protein [Halomonas sp. 3A7M]
MGNGNQASIMQSNGNNTGIIWQVGDDNTASINQQGNSSSFKADIYQNGFKGDVSISQSGSGLRGVSVQQQNLSGNARPVTIDTY